MSDYPAHTTFPAYDPNEVYIEPMPTNVRSVIVDGREFYLINGEWVRKTLFMKGGKE